MTRKYYYEKDYHKKKAAKRKKIADTVASVLIISGIGIMLYYSLPLFHWKIVTEPSLASSGNKNNMVLSSTTSSEASDDWLPKGDVDTPNAYVDSYLLSIPKLHIENAQVSTRDYKLSKHLVQYWGSATPPFSGNTVIFGHSTLPQLFNEKNYQTIFADADTLKVNDEIIVTIDRNTYIYKVFNVFITVPSDLSVLSQDIKGNFLTLITCTPPGTTWKRLIVQAKLIKK